MLHRHLSIKLVVASLVSEVSSYRSIVFERPKNFVYEAGDWIDIESAGRYLQGGQTYSLSSSPLDAHLMITFREGLSPLKRALGSAKPGDEWVITQYGNAYDFRLREHKSSMLIAGGVGIAPFRSMLKEAFEQRTKNYIHLIYLNQTEDFLFKEDLDVWAGALPNLKITYIVTKEFGRSKREKLLASLIGDVGQQFYVAGPPGMVNSAIHLLKSRGVQDRNIKMDSFDGY